MQKPIPSVVVCVRMCVCACVCVAEAMVPPVMGHSGPDHGGPHDWMNLPGLFSLLFLQACPSLFSLFYPNLLNSGRGHGSTGINQLAWQRRKWTQETLPRKTPCRWGLGSGTGLPCVGNLSVRSNPDHLPADTSACRGTLPWCSPALPCPDLQLSAGWQYGENIATFPLFSPLSLHSIEKVRS